MYTFACVCVRVFVCANERRRTHDRKQAGGAKDSDEKTAPYVLARTFLIDKQTFFVGGRVGLSCAYALD